MSWPMNTIGKLIGYSKARYEALFQHPDEFYRNNPEGWELLTNKVTSVLENDGDGRPLYHEVRGRIQLLGQAGELLYG